MKTGLIVIFGLFILLFFFLILCFCLYVTERVKEMEKHIKVIRHQNELLYELFLKMCS